MGQCLLKCIVCVGRIEHRHFLAVGVCLSCETTVVTHMHTRARAHTHTHTRTHTHTHTPTHTHRMKKTKCSNETLVRQLSRITLTRQCCQRSCRSKTLAVPVEPSTLILWIKTLPRYETTPACSFIKDYSSPGFRLRCFTVVSVGDLNSAS